MERHVPLSAVLSPSPSRRPWPARYSASASLSLSLQLAAPLQGQTADIDLVDSARLRAGVVHLRVAARPAKNNHRAPWSWSEPALLKPEEVFLLLLARSPMLMDAGCIRALARESQLCFPTCLP